MLLGCPFAHIDAVPVLLFRANILFVDNPVGTGYSYVDDNSGYTTNEDQIAADLVTLMIAFVNKVLLLQQLYIRSFCLKNHVRPLYLSSLLLCVLVPFLPNCSFLHCW
jgi:hypothetical protein